MSFFVAATLALALEGEHYVAVAVAVAFSAHPFQSCQRTRWLEYSKDLPSSWGCHPCWVAVEGSLPASDLDLLHAHVACVAKVEFSDVIDPVTVNVLQGLHRDGEVLEVHERVVACDDQLLEGSCTNRKQVAAPSIHQCFC